MIKTKPEFSDTLGSLLEKELICLFGRDLVTRAKQTDVINLRLTSELMDSIDMIISQLLKATGKPQEQRELVRGIINTDRKKALVLCMWLMDSGGFI